tara:strand:+ start:696 stop:1589 length:894 start_codon:yes stop_codon:yes gene_type:complete
MKKSQNTSTGERSNVRSGMWRKKVDNSLFRYNGTTIPKWVASQWDLEKYFPDVEGTLRKGDANSISSIVFNNQSYIANITCTFPKRRADKVHRLWQSEQLTDELKSVFVMSHMRDIESGLRGDVGDLEKEIPFWEFIDIEFDPNSRGFLYTPHYRQEPMFPQLFHNLSGSPALKVIEDEIEEKKAFRIHKQDWKLKTDLETEIGAFNAIYTLLDINNQLIYVGEARDLRKRLRSRYPSIPNWTHYRYDVLPSDTPDDMRVSIERMVIRSYASLLQNKSGIDTKDISSYSLANDKIDR